MPRNRGAHAPPRAIFDVSSKTLRINVAQRSMSGGTPDITPETGVLPRPLTQTVFDQSSELANLLERDVLHLKNVVSRSHGELSKVANASFIPREAESEKNGHSVVLLKSSTTLIK